MPQEARAQVLLPPGGVVSRLTLWVNGEEREAAFAGRNRARQAYQQVAIRQRRDPVLVTTAGRDRILVQCFPVQPGGGEMKVRLGITVPLVLEESSHARLRLSHFQDRNFSIPEALNHDVWIESKTQLQVWSKSLQTEGPQPNLYAVRGTMRDAELSEAGASLRSSRTSEITQVWTRDPVKNSKEIVRASVQGKEGPVRSRAQ